MRRRTIALGVFGMISLLAIAMIAASPTSLEMTISRARAGDTIRLAPGDYGPVAVRDRHWERPVTIEAQDAVMVLNLEGVNGLIIRGGKFGPALDNRGYAALVRSSSQISFAGSSFVDAKHGLVIDRSNNVTVDSVTLSGMTADGINIASSQHVRISKSRCTDFNPSPGAHPDCIQLWSRPATGITSDITLTDNVSTGNMQGFSAFNHVRGGVDDGGFDRIVMRGNTVQGMYPQGVAVYDCRNCTVRGNRTSRLPGARWRVSVNIVRCVDCDVGDNSVGL
jgi:hypothetical protein